MARQTTRHRWRFFRAGGFEQVLLESGADLLALRDLDQKLWAALACPADGIELDRQTLALIDTDGDGRIRAPDLLAAIAWAGLVLRTPDSLLDGTGRVPLDAFADNPEGRRLLASAKQILRNLGKPAATEITLEDTTDRVRIFAETRLNGDGVVPPASADDEDLRAAIEDILRVTGGVKDRNGQDGVTQAKVDELFTEAESYSKWLGVAEESADRVLPLGDGTAAAAGALRAVRGKIEDYFTRVKLVAFDPRAAGPLGGDHDDYKALSTRLLEGNLPEVAAFPLAHIEANRPLPLRERLNPAWEGAVATFADAAVTPLLGERAELTGGDFRAIVNRLAPYEAWLSAKPAARVEALGKERVRALIHGGFRERVTALIAEDSALAPEAEAIAEVDKLVRFHRDLRRFAESFVSFRDFYARRRATFQAGTLYIDGRSCDLCIKVGDIASHAAVATRSDAYLVYCELERRNKGEKMAIVAAVTAGDTDTLMVGRNGVFYDRQGNDWDARVVKIIVNSISLRQAFWMPYRRTLRLIEEQLEKFAASRDREAQERLAAGVSDASALAAAAPATPALATPAAPVTAPAATVTALATPAATATPAAPVTALAAPAPTPAAAPAAELPPAVAPRPPERALDFAKYAGVMAALALAVGALGTALGAIVTGFLALRWWQMPLVVAGILLAVSGPSMLIAYMKLRRRNLAPILDPSGWAVNAHARVNIPFGASLTQTAALPSGAERSLADPFEEKRRPWLLYTGLLLLAGAAAVLAWTGHLQTWLQGFPGLPR